jgi:transcriptional regulator of acetoin/glycerol metabolism
VLVSSLDETVEQTGFRAGKRATATPGIVVVVEAGRPARRAFAIPRSGLDIGRGTPQGAMAADDRVSRRHLKIACRESVWAVNDLASRNGTVVNGARLDGYVEFAAPPLIRIGNSLLWAVPDIDPYLGPVPASPPGGPVIGASLARVWDAIAVAGRAGDTLLIRGESGAGKELAARRLHEVCFGPDSSAPFVAVNCAAIPEGLAERLLFGAKRGAYSGAATDTPGYVTAAHQGTLFLDEIAELDLLVQAKLLRVLEAREVLPLGDTRPRSVQIRVVAASHKNLREEVSASRFREDLYFRIGRPEVVLPPLRERIDEMPWLIQQELQRSAADRSASLSFIEACALRAWPGNVREFLREVRLAAHAPLEPGSKQLTAEHLAQDAGRRILTSAAPEPGPASRLEESQIQAALNEHKGNVTRAARALGLHRNQLRRWLAKHPELASKSLDDD